MDLSTMLDMEKICRVCLCSDQELFLIFEDKHVQESTNTIATMMTELTKYKVERFDDLPQLICGACMHAVQNAYAFKSKCEQSYRKLISLLENDDAHKTARAIASTTIKLEGAEYAEKFTQTDSSTMYPCERCEEKFFTFDALRIHREDVHKGSAIICRFCSKSFNRIGYLKTHIAVFHPEYGYTSHNQCQICKRQFTRREHMRRHLAVIHKIVEIVDESPTNSTELTAVTEAMQQLTDNVNRDFTAENNEIEAETETLEIASSVQQLKEKSDIECDDNVDDDERAASLCNDAASMKSDDEDEKPLANLIHAATTPAKGFIEILLKEPEMPDNKERQDEEFIKLQLKRPHTDAAENEDVFAPPIKRGRGRPPRISRVAHTKSLTNEAAAVKEWQCTDCNKIFQQRAAWKRHMAEHDGENKRFPCKICPKRFANADCLQTHMHLIHKASKRTQCDECNETFTHITQFKRHKETKHTERSYKCDVCEKAFTTNVYLQRHMATHGKKRYVCKECSQSYASKDELNVHIKSEKHDKRLLCPECGLRCKTSNILMVHMRRHNGEKPFKCKFCSKGFPRIDDLRVHEKYHTGEKSHFCETCGKGFQRKYNLTIHLRVHSGEKPYKCPHCPQAFAQGNDLKSHIRRHTGERFRCEICNAAFLQGYQIRQHKLNEHNIKEDPPTQRVAKFISAEEQEKQIKQNLQYEKDKTMYSTSTGAGACDSTDLAALTSITNVEQEKQLTETYATTTSRGEEEGEFLSI